MADKKKKHKKEENKSIRKTPNREPPKAVKQVKRIPSDAPTAMIAPSDYQHIYTKGPGKSPKSGKGVQRIPSDAPTAVIAPSDYQHIYRKSPGKFKTPKGAKEVTRIPSDAPTAVIAPSDYQHIYTKSPGKSPKSGKQVQRIPSDAPTAVIAPSDYQHIYAKAQKTPKKVQRIPSDAPTALIPVISVNVPPKGSRAPKEVEEDAPNVIVNASDYEHKTTKGKSKKEIKGQNKSAANIPPKLISEIEEFIEKLPKNYDID